MYMIANSITGNTFFYPFIYVYSNICTVFKNMVGAVFNPLEYINGNKEPIKGHCRDLDSKNLKTCQNVVKS